MKLLPNYRIIITIILLISGVIGGHGQCPDDPKDLIINTQEKFDQYLIDYPDCNQWTIIKVDNKFIGDPNYLGYIVSMVGMHIFILLVLGFVIKWLKLS